MQENNVEMQTNRIRILVRTSVLAFAAIMVIAFLFFIKAASAYTASPFYKYYSLFVVFYVGSRIGASFFFHPEEKKACTVYPLFSFIIPVYNEEKEIINTIAKCFEVDYPKDKFDVIVINDGSTDGSRQQIELAKKKYPQIEAINFDSNKGKREAMAAGIRRSKAEIVVQLDSDSFVTPKSLKKLISPFDDPLIAGVSAITGPANEGQNILTKMQAAYYYVSFRILKAAEGSLGLVFCCSGCCSAYRREYLLPILDGWINEKHFGKKSTFGDDRSLTSILIIEGYKTIFSSTAQAYTMVPATLKQLLKQQTRWKKSWIVNTLRTAKHLIRKDPFIVFVYLIPQLTVAYMAPLVTIYALIYIPVFEKHVPFFYLLGLLCIYLLFILYYGYLRDDKHRGYILLWGLLNIFLSAVIFPYALLTIRDTRWGTR